ncbi:hypothetical protein [Streptomyces bluensis]|uniref:Uncharacterized protein n=1 Tax=Streptomyces bluensis TaxID=33897 RepID=A0ABW6UJL1_9ACTN
MSPGEGVPQIDDLTVRGRALEGLTGSVLADGSEPRPVYLDIGSGAVGQATSEWWRTAGGCAGREQRPAVEPVLR